MVLQPKLDKSDFWIDLPACFSIPELCPNPENSELITIIKNTICNSSDFLSIRNDNGQLTHTILIKYLAVWYFRINIRLIKIHSKYFTIDSKHFLSQVNSLLIYDHWKEIPHEIIDFGVNNGFISITKDNNYFFPIGFVFREFYKDKNNLFLLNQLEENSFEQKTLVLEECLNGEITDFFHWFEIYLDAANLEERQKDVLLRREGINRKKEKLEEIARYYGLTRERIRQIETKAWKNIVKNQTCRKICICAILSHILRNKGSLIFYESINIVQLFFRTLSLQNHPQPLYGTQIYTDINLWDNEIRRILEEIPMIEFTELFELLSNDLHIATSDIAVISTIILEQFNKSLTKSELVQFALKSIGKPAHYSEIHEKICELFPHLKLTVNNVHSKLDRLTHKNDVVWIGIKGTYALKEWGYVKPDRTIFQTVAEIVRINYQQTGKPVSSNFIKSRIGKYRRVVNNSSIVIAITFNEEIVEVKKGYFIPKEECSEKSVIQSKVIEDGEIHQGLTKFRETKNHKK